MNNKFFDIYSVIGLLISIFAVGINYLLPEKIPTIYILIGLIILSGIFAFIIQLSFFISKFSGNGQELVTLKQKLNLSENRLNELEQKIKIQEEFNKLKEEIMELRNLYKYGKK